MRTLEVQAPGLLTTVQDLGRFGFGAMGVSPSGAADALSLRVGNLLVGNPQNTAALEMTLLGGSFRFSSDSVVAPAGSDFGAALDSTPLALWTAAAARAGQSLRLGPTRAGARCYLCVRGGIAVARFLGSASTHLLSGLGGFEGRALRPGDVVPIGEPAGETPPPSEPRTVPTEFIDRLLPRKILRVTVGPQSDWFSDSSRALFYNSPYRVAEESNRMGIRMQGPPVSRISDREMITEGVPLGAIQVFPNGHPAILFVEHQTTGGYPKIANVIAADLHSVGQLRPRDEVRFELVSMETARALLVEQEQLLAAVERALR